MEFIVPGIVVLGLAVLAKLGDRLRLLSFLVVAFIAGAHFQWDQVGGAGLNQLLSIWYDIFLSIAYLFLFWCASRVVYWLGSLPASLILPAPRQPNRWSGESASAGILFVGGLLLADRMTERTVYFPSEECIYMMLTIPISAALTTAGNVFGYSLQRFLSRKSSDTGDDVPRPAAVSV